MEAILWITIAVIYSIATGNNRTGRMFSNRRSSMYGRYGLLGMEDDFSLEFDPLADIRQAYNERLQVYYAHNKPRTYLINAFCEAKIIVEGKNTWFYVKARTNGKFAGAYFEVKGDNAHVSTMWAIIDMEFNALSKFNNIKNLYYKLNKGYITTGGLKYFYQPLFGGLPKPITNKSAQNEYCRMEIKTLSNGEKFLICSEIWGSGHFDKPRKFIINADKLILYSILFEFSKNKNKMQDYLNLLYLYLKRTDCTVREIKDNLNQAKTSQLDNESNILQESKKEQEQIHNNHEKSEVSEKLSNNKENIDENLPSQNIKKHNERNIDL